MWRPQPTAEGLVTESGWVGAGMDWSEATPPIAGTPTRSVVRACSPNPGSGAIPGGRISRRVLQDLWVMATREGRAGRGFASSSG